MVIPTMEPIDIIKEIKQDYNNIQYKLEYLKSKAIKKFRKENLQQNYLLEDYTHVMTKNKYVVGWRIDSLVYDNVTPITYCVVPFENNTIVLSTMDVSCMSKVSNKLITIPGLVTYNPHFWQRYKERVLKNPDMPFKQMVANFLCRNRENIDIIQLNEDILVHFKSYGKHSGYALNTYDGLCPINSGFVGDFEPNICFCITFKTILPFSILNLNQQKALKEAIVKNRVELNNFITMR